MKKSKKKIIMAMIGLVIIMFGYSVLSYGWAAKVSNAARDNDIRKLETLMNFRFVFDIDRCASKGLWVITSMDMLNEPPLYAACRCGNIDAMAILLSSGADSDYVTKEGYTPMDIILEEYHESDIDAIKLLVEYGADISKNGDNGEEILVKCASMDPIREWADEKKFEVYVNYDEEYAVGITKIYRYLEGISNLENPVSSESGITALEGAASSGNIQLVKYLLNKEKVDINHRDSMGMTALFMTPEWREEEDFCIVIAEMLLKNGIDPLIKNSEGVAAEEYAKKSGFTKLEMLLSEWED